MVILFYGLSGAGKTTLATEYYKLSPNTSFLLDGDVLRTGLCSDLGFSPEDRRENLRRVIECARLISFAGRTALVSMIAPYEDDRQMAREICSDVEFVDVFVDCPLEVCEERDVKGLYKKARAGEIECFTGISDPFELPESVCYTLRTHLGSSPALMALWLYRSIWNGEYLIKERVL